MDNEFPYRNEGRKLTELISKKGYSIYKFSMLCRYSTSRMYRLCRGEDDIATISVYNAIMFARVLGFKYVDDMYEAIGIDILEDLR